MWRISCVYKQTAMTHLAVCAWSLRSPRITLTMFFKLAIQLWIIRHGLELRRFSDYSSMSRKVWTLTKKGTFELWHVLNRTIETSDVLQMTLGPLSRFSKRNTALKNDSMMVIAMYKLCIVKVKFNVRTYSIEIGVQKMTTNREWI